MRKIVAVDMDDTICHLMPRCIHYHNIQFPEHLLKLEDCVRFKLEGIWHPNCNYDTFFGRPGLYRELDLVDQFVIPELKKLHEKHDLIIITASTPQAMLEKWEWLQEHAPFIPVSNYFPVKRKDMVEFDVLIDDGGHNLLAAKEKGRRVIGIPRPWNADVRKDYLFRENDSWEGMADFVDQVLKGKLDPPPKISDYHPNLP